MAKNLSKSVRSASARQAARTRKLRQGFKTFKVRSLTKH
jgi:hypothetical protein